MFDLYIFVLYSFFFVYIPLSAGIVLKILAQLLQFAHFACYRHLRRLFCFPKMFWSTSKLPRCRQESRSADRSFLDELPTFKGCNSSYIHLLISLETAVRSHQMLVVERDNTASCIKRGHSAFSRLIVLYL